MIVYFKQWFFPLFSVLLGTVLALMVLELLLLAGHHLIVGKQTTQNNSKVKTHSPNQSRTIIFSGDSWTYGSDALPNEGFFHQLSRDPEYERYTLLNLGHPSYNYFQIINKIVELERIPKLVIITGGTNSWHLLGLNSFITHAKIYLSAEEFRQFNTDFKEEKEQWYTRLRTYKLFLYLLRSSDTQVTKQARIEFDQQEMDAQLGSNEFWRALDKFRIQYPDYQLRKMHIGTFLQNYSAFTLDQKFYFAIVHCGLKPQDIEPSMKKAGLFYPEKLTVIPYEAYEELYMAAKSLKNEVSKNLIFWSLRVLKNWAAQHGVVVFIQTYPEIIPSNSQSQWFINLNEIIKRNTHANGFWLINHNLANIEWQKVATPFHVNTLGHTYMKNKIHEVLTGYFGDETNQKNHNRK